MFSLCAVDEYVFLKEYDVWVHSSIAHDFVFGLDSVMVLAKLKGFHVKNIGGNIFKRIHFKKDDNVFIIMFSAKIDKKLDEINVFSTHNDFKIKRDGIHINEYGTLIKNQTFVSIVDCLKMFENVLNKI